MNKPDEEQTLAIIDLKKELGLKGLTDKQITLTLKEAMLELTKELTEEAKTILRMIEDERNKN